MTTRPHLSATQGGGRRTGLRWWCWADLGRLKLGCARVKKQAGPRWLAGWAKRVGRAAKARSGPSKKEELGEEKETLQIFKGIQANEFKHRFEFNQSKVVLQH
jgi:hypothetical protein